MSLHLTGGNHAIAFAVVASGCLLALAVFVLLSPRHTLIPTSGKA